ncbi:hypothetical protein ATCC90586_001735 [Pythium insidiosum]|nr:hypothetical protein ATCC90586_001735 [Pythium insidiosum]
MAVGHGADAVLAPDLDALLPPNVVAQLVTLPHDLVDAALGCAAAEMRQSALAGDAEVTTSTTDVRAYMERLAATHGLEEASLKCVYAALSSLLVRAARENATMTMHLHDVFDEFGIHEKGLMDVLIECLPRYLSKVQSVLRQSSM